jgi:hypothetical protein
MVIVRQNKQPGKVKRNKADAVRKISLCEEDSSWDEEEQVTLVCLGSCETAVIVRGGCNALPVRVGILFRAQNGDFVVTVFRTEYKVQFKYEMQAVNSLINTISITTVKCLCNFSYKS